MRTKGARLYLAQANASRDAVRRRLAGQARGQREPLRWIFLGRDHRRLRAWERTLGAGFQRVRCGKELQQVGLQWRRQYLEWIGALGRRYAGLGWWTSRIAERNTYGYSLYHDICYLLLARSAAGEGGDLLIVAESWALLRTIAGQAELERRAVWIGGRVTVRPWLAWALAMVVVWTWYVATSMIELLAARWSGARKGFEVLGADVRRVLIHSCVDESYFGSDGAPPDRYFGPLPQELRVRGWDVRIIPWLFSLRRSRRAAFTWFSERADQYLIPEAVYTLADYAWSAWVVLQGARLPRGRHVFGGMEIAHLVREAQRRQALQAQSARYVRYVRLIRHLKKLGCRVDVFIDTFENMVTEKPQIIGLREHMPTTMTVGYQHYLASHPLMLNQCTTPEEAAIAPLPDVIVCTSPSMAERMSSEGFPRCKLREGPSLRYLHLLAEPMVDQAERHDVLVVMPIDRLVAEEMLDKIVQAFPEDEGITFHLKPHPMMSRRSARAVRPPLRLPHYALAKGEMSGWLRRTSVAVVAGGTSGVELLLAGMPVVVVGREADFDMNPLAWFPELDGPAYSPEELRDAILGLLADRDGRRQAVRAWARRQRARLLRGLDDDGIEAFVKPLGDVAARRTSNEGVELAS